MNAKQIEEVRGLVGNGMAIKRIAQLLNITVVEIKSVIIKNGFKIIKEEFDDSKIDNICYLYRCGVSAKQLGIKFSISKLRIQKWVERSGDLRSKNESHRFVFFNEYVFDEIDTPDKAYWLGFMYADGSNAPNINTFTVSLKREDHLHLIKLSRFVGLPDSAVCEYIAKIKDKETGEEKEYPASKLRMYSKHICFTMSKHGCVNNKSFIITFPEWLDKTLIPHFIRGLSDGDGSLTYRVKHGEWKWSVVSTKECCESLKKIIMRDCGLEVSYRYISETGNNTYELETSGNEKILKIMNWIYQESNENSRLNRKYDKYTDLKSKQDIIHGRKIIISKSAEEFSSVIEIEEKKLTAKYIRTLNIEERERLVAPIYEYFKKQGWIFPEFTDETLQKEYDKLLKFKPNIGDITTYGNSFLATNICKKFCKSFYNELVDIWNNDDFLLKLIRNRLVINWNSDERFSISMRMMIQGMRSMRLGTPLTMFKPSVAKYICERYSKPGDVVGDYSAGFGGRLLGAVSSGRKYIGTDPMTALELQEMISFFGFKNCTLLNIGSEHFIGERNSVDLYYSSPPYYDYEKYSSSSSQAYNCGENYFYNIYWRKTLDNVYAMLKSGKWFGLNLARQPRMLDMAIKKFGPPIEEVKLKLGRSHLTKSAGAIKYEPIYMFKKI